MYKDDAVISCNQKVFRKISLCKKVLLWFEFSLIYLGFPLFYAYKRTSSPIIYLLTLGLFSFILLYRSRAFRNKIFLNGSMLVVELPRILLIFTASTLSLLLITYVFFPDSLFFCIKKHFLIWCSLMFFYPLLSVYPQELIYRAFLFHRYRQLFSSEVSVIHLSAVAFSFGHIIYFHPLSMILTFFGGYIFAWTYKKTESLLAVSVEHAMYGCLLYTIGLGRFFYSGFDQLIR